MSSNHFFVAKHSQVGEFVPIEKSDAHKITHVLRMSPGDEIIICDSAANEFRAILEVDGNTVRAKLVELVASNTESAIAKLRITVAQAIPKGQKMDFVVEKLTELGVATIIPLLSERTIGDAGDAKLERWRRLAKAASQQSGRRNLLEIAPPTPLRELTARFNDFDAALFPWELAPQKPPLHETLVSLFPPSTQRCDILIAIGPEGGFSHDEANVAHAAGAIIISLGPQILRTETAALVLTSILSYQRGVY